MGKLRNLAALKDRATPPWLNFSILALLAISGWLVNAHAPTPFFGIRLLLGSTFSIFSFLLFRGKSGILVAIPSSLVTISLFGEPYTAIRFLGEITFLTYLNRGSSSDLSIRKGSLIWQVAIYSIFIGGLFLYLTERLLLGSNAQIALFLYHKNFVSSILNVVLAYAFYSALELWRNGRASPGQHQISITTLCSVGILSVVIACGWTIEISHYRTSYKDMEAILLGEKNYIASSIVHEIERYGIEAMTNQSLLTTILQERVKIKTISNAIWDEGPVPSKASPNPSELGTLVRLRFDNGQEIVSNPLFFKNFDKTMRQSNDFGNTLKGLEIFSPAGGSRVDRYLNSYWYYDHDLSDSSSLKSIELITSTHDSIQHLQSLTNQSAFSLGCVIFVGLILSQLSATLLEKEFQLLTRFRETTDECDELRASQLPYSPISELNSAIESVNINTEKLVLAKQQIEALSAVTARQMSTAAQIQQYFLSNVMPKASHFELEAFNRPAYDVGGDWYDCFTIRDRLFFVVADVCDKGVGSALFMSVFRTLIRYTTMLCYEDEAQDTPILMASIITRVNDYMALNHQDCMYFATVFFGSIELNEDNLIYVSAGHESPLLLKPDGSFEELSVGGPAIGLFYGADYLSRTAPFETGSLLVAYTDGVTDARDPNGESFGLPKLRQLVVESKNLQPRLIEKRVIDQLDQHMGDAEQFDDITLVILAKTS